MSEGERYRFCERCEVEVTFENEAEHYVCSLQGCVSTWILPRPSDRDSR